MATMAKLHVSPYTKWTVHSPLVRQGFPPSILTWDSVSAKGRCRIRFRPCRSFRSEDEPNERVSKGEILKGKNGLQSKTTADEVLRAIRSFVWKFSKPSSRSQALEQLEEKLSGVIILLPCC